MLTINDLPNEILEIIISHLTPYKDLDNCHLVCHRWADLARNERTRKNLWFQQALEDGNLRWQMWNPGGAWTPVGRSSHAATVNKDVMYIFGGRSKHGDYFLNDLWALDLSTRMWQKCNSQRHQPYPTPKEKATMVSHEEKLIVFGGFRTPWEVHNELYAFDLLERVWFCPERKSPQPPEMCGHSATVHGNEMVVFGGYHQTILAGGKSNDVWTLNLEDFQWKLQKTTERKPAPRCYHFQIKLDDENLLVIGGQGIYTNFRDMWLLTMTSPEWIWREIPVRQRDYEPSSLTSSYPACEFSGKLIVLAEKSVSRRAESSSELGIFVCDLSRVLDSTNPLAEWLKPRRRDICPGVPHRGFMYSSLAPGKTELICFGGTSSDFSDHIPANYLHFINAPFRSVIF